MKSISDGSSEGASSRRKSPNQRTPTKTVRPVHLTPVDACDAAMADVEEGTMKVEGTLKIPGLGHLTIVAARFFRRRM